VIKKTFVGYIPPSGTKEAGVYIYRHLETGKIYIGSTVDAYGRFIQHTSALARGDHINREFQKAYDKSPYFEVSFSKLHPEKTNMDPLLMVRHYEQTLIDAYAGDPRLMNVAKDVFACGSAISPTQETREKISIAMKGRHVSEETKRRRSQSLMGHVVSDETKEKIRQSKLGRVQTEEHRAKSKMAAMTNARSVIVDGVEYPSVTDAGRAFGIKPNSAIKRIASKNPEFSGWNYADPYAGHSPSI